MEDIKKTAPVKRVKTGGRKLGVKNKQTRTMMERAKPYADKAITVVYKLLKSSSETIRLNAAKELIDRGYGKAQQVIESKVNQTVEIVTTDTDLARRAAFMLARAEKEKPQDITLN